MILSLPLIVVLFLGNQVGKAVAQNGQNTQSDVQLYNPFFQRPYTVSVSQPEPPSRFQTIKRSNPYTLTLNVATNPNSPTTQIQTISQQPVNQQFQRRPQYPVSQFPTNQPTTNLQPQPATFQQTRYPPQQQPIRSQYRPWNPVPWNYTLSNPLYQNSNPLDSPAQYKPQPQTYAPTNTPSRATQLKYLFGSGTSQPQKAYPERTLPQAQWGIPSSYNNLNTPQQPAPNTNQGNPYQINPLNPYTQRPPSQNPTTPQWPDPPTTSPWQTVPRSQWQSTSTTPQWQSNPPNNQWQSLPSSPQWQRPQTANTWHSQPTSPWQSPSTSPWPTQTTSTWQTQTQTQYYTQPEVTNRPLVYYEYAESDIRTPETYWSPSYPGMADMGMNDPSRNQIQGLQPPIPRVPEQQYSTYSQDNSIGSPSSTYPINSNWMVGQTV